VKGLIYLLFIIILEDLEGIKITTLLSKAKFDNQFKNKFIGKYRPFIIKVVLDFTFIKGEVTESDEFSIGLMAFNEAIDSYDLKQNYKFINFAKKVIERRIIDYLRQEKKRKVEYPFSYFIQENNHELESMIPVTDKNSTKQFERIELFEEICNLKLVLKTFKIKIDDLPNFTPKYKGSKNTSLKIANKIATDKILFEEMMKKKKIPMTQLEKYLEVHPKTVERNRKFIITVSLILGMGYEHLGSYIKSGSV
jgi:RNA polymerase sigma factor